MTDGVQGQDKLEHENRELRARLRELEDTLSAIRNGEVDAVVVAGPKGDQVYSLKGADRTYRLLIEELHEGALTLDQQGTVLFANRFLIALLGVAQESLTGGRFADFVAGSDRQAFASLLDRARSQSAAAEIALIRGDGAVVPAYAAATQTLIEGRLTFCLAITDLTEQKAHQTILAAEQLARSIIDQSTEGIIVCDGESRIIRASAGALDLAGPGCLQRPFGEALRIRIRPTPESGAEAAPQDFAVEQVVTGASVRACQALATGPDGREREIVLSAAPLVGADGAVIGAIVNLVDLTEVLGLERSLKQAVSAANVGLWEWDVVRGQGRFSAEFCQMIGYREGELDLDTAGLLDLIHPDDRDALPAWFGTGRAPKTHAADLEVRLRHRNGDDIWAFVRYSVVADEAGRPAKAFGSVLDITAKKAEEAERSRLEKELSQARKMESLGTLAGGIAHDFNNILAGILGFTELARDDAPPGSLQDAHLQKVYNAGLRARDIVTRILTFARQSDESQRPLRLDHVIGDALPFLRATIPATIEIRPAIETTASIMGNSTEMHQVIMNLCTNAANAMESSGGVLDITLREADSGDRAPDRPPKLAAGRHVILTVADTGVGIAPDDLEHIFDPYFSAGKNGKGTGLGLALVHGIIDRAGGAITVASEPGRGTVISVYLPVTAGTGDSAPAPAEDLPRGRGRILVVDDEALVAETCAAILVRLGYDVTSTCSSEDALARFATSPDSFDLVITDMTMPRMTGDRLAQEMLVLRPDIPIVLMTGYSSMVDESAAARLGIRAFTHKPLVREELARTVHRLLKGGEPV
jgi:PAS domain S-box-containing protein